MNVENSSTADQIHIYIYSHNAKIYFDIPHPINSEALYLVDKEDPHHANIKYVYIQIDQVKKIMDFVGTQ